MDVAELIRLQNQGTRLKFLFFWGHRTPGRGYLSQWWPSPFTLGKVTYATAEHYMMAEKARLFGDEETAAAIVAAPHPGAAKDLGRRIRDFDERTWQDHRVAIVTRGNEAKFTQNEDLRDYLRGTRPRILVEASPLDRIWGIGMAADDPRAEDAASSDHTVRIWADGGPLVLRGHTDEVWDVTWSPDGTRLATASHDRTVRIWEAVTDDAALVARARSRVFRRLTRDERHALMIPAPRPAPEGAGSPG